jgi:hypothetical protein
MARYRDLPHTLVAQGGVNQSESKLTQFRAILGPVREMARVSFCDTRRGTTTCVLLTRPPRARSLEGRGAPAPAGACVLFSGQGGRGRGRSGVAGGPLARRVARRGMRRAVRAREAAGRMPGGWGYPGGRGGYVPARGRGRVYHPLSRARCSVQVNAGAVVLDARSR